MKTKNRLGYGVFTLREIGKDARCRLTLSDYKAIRKAVRCGATHLAVSRVYGVSRQRITAIINNGGWWTRSVQKDTARLGSRRDMKPSVLKVQRAKNMRAYYKRKNVYNDIEKRLFKPVRGIHTRTK